MAVKAVQTESAARGYRSNSVTGLSDEQTLIRGLHGVVVYLHRARLIVEKAETDKDAAKAQQLAKADNLLAFLLKLADTETEMGSTLVRCYTGIQQLLAASLASVDDSESKRALDDALGQARELERTIRESVGGDSNGQAH